MNTQEFDPTQLDPNANLTDEQRLALQQQEEERRQAAEKAEADRLESERLEKERLEAEEKARAEEAARAAQPAPVVQAPTNEQPAQSLSEVRSMSISAGMRDAPSGNLSLSEDQLKVKQLLSSQAKRTIFLPLEPGERRGVAFRSVTLNGYRCEVKKGMQVEVPEAIYNILMESMSQEAEATEIEENLDRADPRKKSALGLE